MFSFFTKKSQNSDSPVIIQGPATEQQQNNGDDFIFVEKKDDRPAQPPIYPTMPAPPFGGAPYPSLPYGHPTTGTAHRNVAPPPVPYVQDVPFVLAPQLCMKSTFDSTQTEVDGILAFLTRQMSVDECEDYNFTLERSIQNELL